MINTLVSCYYGILFHTGISFLSFNEPGLREGWGVQGSHAENSDSSGLVPWSQERGLEGGLGSFFVSFGQQLARRAGEGWGSRSDSQSGEVSC